MWLPCCTHVAHVWCNTAGAGKHVLKMVQYLPTNLFGNKRHASKQNIRHSKNYLYLNMHFCLMLYIYIYIYMCLYTIYKMTLSFDRMFSFLKKWEQFIYIYIIAHHCWLRNSSYQRSQDGVKLYKRSEVDGDATYADNTALGCMFRRNLIYCQLINAILIFGGACNPNCAVPNCDAKCFTFDVL